MSAACACLRSLRAAAAARAARAAARSARRRRRARRAGRRRRRCAAACCAPRTAARRPASRCCSTRCRRTAPPGAAARRQRRRRTLRVRGRSTTTRAPPTSSARATRASPTRARACSFAAGEREREVEVRIHEVTDDDAGAALRELRVRLDWLGDRLEVSRGRSRVDEPGRAHRLRAAGGERAGRAPAVALGLPGRRARADRARSACCPRASSATAATLRWFGPALPGRSSELGYQLRAAGPGGRAAHRARAARARRSASRVLAPAGGPAVAARRARREGEPTVDRRARLPRALGRARAGSLALELAVPAARSDPGAVSLARGAHPRRARRRRLRRARGARDRGRRATAPVARRRRAPAARDPAARRAPRTCASARRSSATRLVPLPDGAGIGVLGPLAPGETVLEVRYRLPAGDGPFTLERRFAAQRAAALGVPRRHRQPARPSRSASTGAVPRTTPDRSYIHLEAFEVAPDETVALRDRDRCRPAASLPRAALVAFVALAAGLAAFALARRRCAARAGGARRRDRRARVRGASASARRCATPLGDLEHDFETGKLDAADYETHRARSCARARPRRSLRSRAAPRAPAFGRRSAPRAAGAARRAGARRGADDRFCARCGTRARVSGRGRSRRAGSPDASAPVVALASARPRRRRRAASLAVLGPNGAGKSTLLRLLAGSRGRAPGRVAIGGAGGGPPRARARASARRPRDAPLPGAHRAREPALRRRASSASPDPGRARRRAARRASSSARSPIGASAPSRAARRSASRSRARWCTTRRCCSSTSPSRASTRAPPSASRRCVRGARAASAPSSS